MVLIKSHPKFHTASFVLPRNLFNFLSAPAITDVKIRKFQVFGTPEKQKSLLELSVMILNGLMFLMQRTRGPWRGKGRRTQTTFRVVWRCMQELELFSRILMPKTMIHWWNHGKSGSGLIIFGQSGDYGFHFPAVVLCSNLIFCAQKRCVIYHSLVNKIVDEWPLFSRCSICRGSVGQA